MGLVRAPIILPTLPSFSAAGELAGRTELLAGLTFIEGASGWSASDVCDWFTTYALELRRESPPASVMDAVVGTAPLSLSGPPTSRPTRPDQLSRLLAMTRWQVILTLRGLLVTPADDRFLHAAIFSNRVRRDGGAWRLEAGDGHALSDVVLSLFAVDVLTHREFHEQNLCVCDVCGRVSYNPRATTRAGCTDHIPGSDATSGVQGRGSR
jgi:hypothetical protein